MLTVEIWSDIVCPFCYIGKRHFEQAGKQFPHPVEVKWRSFELQKDAPKKQEQDLATRLAQKYGKSLEWAKAMNQQVTEKAAHVGVTFHLDKVIPTNSFDGHRLIHLAQTFGLQDEAKERLLAAYFTEGKDISDHPTLVDLGREIGLEVEDVQAMLESDRYGAEVRADEQLASEIEISGVPFFVIDQRYAISGAQPVEVFVETLHKVWAEEHKK
ncbi:MAG: DsbA family oxidoreductase [Oligoflexus sp.]|nr:DsbA family oxidoreductase [Oligoflexus sp.]